MSDPVEFKFNIQPICLPPESTTYEAGEIVYATGWGTTSYFGFNSDLLLEVGVWTVDREKCIMDYKKYGKKINDEVMICAGSPFGGKDACGRDSGGPLNALDTTTYRWILYGVTSFGEQCGLPDAPGVYTKVVPYLQWIRQTLK
ncbi:unnamed protein product [Soboliphyme baturini]|uniref:Peptidase S1 domain-containing protein n=1 Tax=Soboliphyme baturini TaxID=241478 RepID=A0A3P8DBM3_9BILA|nr:unnamed protein product [Soboliphyme baturini]